MKKFKDLTISERLKKLNLDSSFLKPSLDEEILERIGENPIGFFELPVRVLNDLRVNGKTYNVPMVTEEASVVAGACYGAKLCSNVRAEVKEDVTLSHIFFTKKPEFDKKEILKKVNSMHKHSRLLDIQLEQIEGGFVLKLIIDSGESMGAAVSSKMAEEVSEMVKGGVGRVVSNIQARLVEASACVDKIENADKIELLSEWAKQDKSRAVTHNKGIMNGVTAVALATGQDTRAIEAACYSLACEKDGYAPLSEWKIKGSKLCGRVRLMIPCGIVGGELKNYPKARKCLSLMQIKSSNELAEVMAAVGLVQNLAALNMLAGVGVTKGHGNFRN